MSSEAAAYFPSGLVEVSNTGAGADDRSHSQFDSTSSSSIAEPSDEQLLSQVGLGSRDALGILFRRHARAVFHVAWRILRDKSEADDLRQEVFLYLSERSQRFDPQKGSGASWIMQVTYHRAIDRRRYLDFRQHYSAEEFDEQRMPTTAAQPSPETFDGRAIRSRLKEQLTAAQQQTWSFTSSKGIVFARSRRETGKRWEMSGTTITGHWNGCALISFQKARLE